MLWLYVYFSQLQLDRDQYLYSQVQGKECPPSIIYNPVNNKIVQACFLSQKSHIQVGQGLAAASALCNQLRVLTYDATLETQCLQELAIDIYPLIGEITLDPPKGLYLRLDRTVNYYGSLKELWTSIHFFLKQTCYQFSYASAFSPQAAKLLAYSQLNQILNIHSDILAALQNQPITHLHIDEKNLKKLSRVGIKTIGQLLALPTADIVKRFDKDTLVYLTSLRGERFSKLTSFFPPEIFNKHLVLPYEVSHAEVLIRYAKIALESLSQYLIQRNKQATYITFVLCYREHPQSELLIHSASPQHKMEEWLTLTSLKLEQFALPAPVTELHLNTKELVELEATSHDFFSPQQNALAKAQLIGKLITRLDKNNVYQPEPQHDHRVEKKSNQEKEVSAYKLNYPLHIRENPISLTTKTRVIYGPERLYTGWWNTKMIQRDYFIAQSSTGSYLWIYKDEKDNWYQQGWFA